MVIKTIDTIECNKSQLVGKIEEYHNLGYFVNVKVSNIEKGDYFSYLDCTYILDIIKMPKEVAE